MTMSYTKPVHLFSSETYKDYLSTLYDLNDGEDLKSMQDLYETPKYKLSKDDQEEMKELKERRCVCFHAGIGQSI